jgi:hypothetical protein
MRKLLISFLLVPIFSLFNQSAFGQNSNKKVTDWRSSQDSIIRLIKDSSHIVLDFETGFAKSPVTIRNKNGKVILKDTLTTIDQWGLSERFFFRKSEFPLIIECQNSSIHVDQTRFKFIYINKSDSRLLINYSQKFKFYE